MKPQKVTAKYFIFSRLFKWYGTLLHLTGGRVFNLNLLYWLYKGTWRKDDHLYETK